ncbi:UDP-N-acetylmuramoyl-L-alanyl-D-glutamate--2,6-diaminopimelate ligase [Nitrococcus mobilis]|uniref:UDP-N-acetylmuramoyl-L-alanyl-D-glutamate--2,6-diaminopimelate ligase n=1 Tax=Nitrococcus mobilis Nb-231 TaxID=314278 RepID=A4BQJ1_9GAMM|nr:UDP-N-acetylmuramoyl-L-alanyl-D-glutamate--2,6-diaminopimelate ligase [Nitrococcus mobilis]EAR21841.1 UDP-N-acetylmuramyl-tripeptide synthetase [Nitrococcus mobilis Nb-231]
MTAPLARAAHRLRGLLEPLGIEADERPIHGVAVDSRAVRPGYLFMAVQGTLHHGGEFAAEALSQGAAAILWQPTPGFDDQALSARCAKQAVPCIAVHSLHAQVGIIAARFYGDPGANMTVIGVTGTDGKTSVSQFIAHALGRKEYRCGILGTLGCGLPGHLRRVTSLTTPDPITLQCELNQLRARHAQAVVIEVSSHALDQQRLAGVGFDVAVLTNLSRDHLDYHPSQAAYAQAKALLFQRPELHTVVVNVDDDFGRSLRASVRHARVIGYSLAGIETAQLRCLRLAAQSDGLRLLLDAGGCRAAVRVGLLGRFNAANVLAALGALLALDVPLREALQRLSLLQPVSGRMERYGSEGRPTVVIDYAHTPAGLQAALAAMREHFAGRIWCVFGCGGDRDRGKRPLMGALARASADRIIITNDNPRTENPRRIIAEIQAGAGADSRVRVIEDRREAVIHSIRAAAPEDAILVAGKGHEEYQLIGTRQLPYSDRETVKQALGGGH